MKTLRADPFSVFAAAAIAANALILALVAVRRYDTFQAFGDLTAFGQFFSNSLRGDWFQSSYPWSVHDYWSLIGGGPTVGYPPDVSSLGIHFEVGLAVLLPIYALWPHAETLVVLQSAIVMAAGIAIYLFARRRVGPVLGLGVLGSFLLHPAIAGFTTTDFHAQTLLTCWIAFTLLALESGRMRWFAALGALTLLTNEVAAIPMTMIGVYLMLVKRRWVVGAVTTALSAAYWVVVTSFVIPAFSPTHTYLFSGYFSHWGGTVGGLLHAMITNPLDVLAYLTGPTQILYLLALFGPTLLLPLLAPEVLAIAAPVIVANLLADSDAQRLMSTHYSATVIPVLYFSTVVGLARLRAFLAARPRLPVSAARTALALSAALVAAGAFDNSLGPYPLVKSALQSGYAPPTNAATLERLIGLIPPGTSISTVDNFSTHVSDHREVNIFPVYAAQVDYVLLPTNGERMWPLTPDDETKFLTPLLNSSDHEVVADQDGYILVRRKR